MTQEPKFDIELSPGVNRTQESSAYARFHYHRGYEAAMDSVRKDNLDCSVIVVLAMLIAFAAGWLLRR